MEDLREEAERDWETLVAAVRVYFPMRAYDYPKGPSLRREQYIRRRLEENSTFILPPHQEAAP